MSEEFKQPEVNIGTAGHVDHGKTTLVQAITGIWTAKHSEEIKRGMTIKLGYADASIGYCEGFEGPEAYVSTGKCPDGSEPKFLRRISFVDSPGHEALMATMLSGAMVMDGAILVIACNEPFPQPQTLEHLVALSIIGVKNLVIVQNKIDVVPKEKVLKNYEEIVNFLQNTPYKDSVIIPISALHKVNVDAVIQAIQEEIPTPPRDPSKPPLMFVIRSFDINKPGTKPKGLAGGVVGGSIMQGVLRVGDEIEIKPGVKLPKGGAKDSFVYEPLVTDVVSLKFGEHSVREAKPGGLVAVGTSLDPSLTKADALVGSILGLVGKTPPIVKEIVARYELLQRFVGTKELVKMTNIEAGEVLIVTVGAATRVASVTGMSKDRVTLRFREPVSTDIGMKIAISRRVLGRWRLAGWGVIEEIVD